MKTICIGELSEKDLRLLKDFYENKYSKIISQAGFEKFLSLSASQHVLFKKGENPFVPKTARYFDGPFLDIEVDIQPGFSIRYDIYPQQIITYPSSLIYASVGKLFINDEYFPQELFKGTESIARLQIVSIKEACYLASIIDLANKEMKGSKNLSKFLIKVLHNIALNYPELLDPFKKSSIIIPFESKRKAKDIGYPIPILSERVHDGKFVWSWGWSSCLYPQGFYVALLSQK